MLEHSSFDLMTYTLCPNTVFEIGEPDDNLFCCQNGDVPIYARSRSIIRCGEDGSSNNNCTLKGGYIQFLHGPMIFREFSAFDVLLQGITFDDASLYSALLGQQGDVTFEDCIFRVRKLFFKRIFRFS